jgi:hypothetical protein
MLAMLQYWREQPAYFYYFWLLAGVVAIVAIYYVWGRKSTPKDENKPGSGDLKR